MCAQVALVCAGVCMCVCAGVCWGFHTTCFARTQAEAVPAGWGADGGDLGEGAAMHSGSLPFAAMGVCLYVCMGRGSNDDPRNRTCNPFSLSRIAIGSKEDMDRVLEEMTPCLPLPPPPRQRFQWGFPCP